MTLQMSRICMYLGRAVIGPPHGCEGHGKGLTAVQGWFCPIEPSPALQVEKERNIFSSQALVKHKWIL